MNKASRDWNELEQSKNNRSSVFLNPGERVNRERRENEATGVIDQSEVKSHKTMTTSLKQ